MSSHSDDSDDVYFDESQASVLNAVDESNLSGPSVVDESQSTDSSVGDESQLSDLSVGDESQLSDPSVGGESRNLQTSEGEADYWVDLIKAVWKSLDRQFYSKHLGWIRVLTKKEDEPWMYVVRGECPLSKPPSRKYIVGRIFPLGHQKDRRNIYMHLEDFETELRLLPWCEECDRSICWGCPDEVCDEWDYQFLDCLAETQSYCSTQNSRFGFDFKKDMLSFAKPEKKLSTSETSVALCVTTKNRLWQLRHALIANILHCMEHREWVTIYLVDFGDDDDNEAVRFVMDSCVPALWTGLLRVYQTSALPVWHASVAKNTAHFVAMQAERNSPKDLILVNLDGDNFVGPGFVTDVLERFCAGAKVVQYENGMGTCGRLAYWSKDFRHLRGYDQDSYPMGAQDVDMALRLANHNSTNLIRDGSPAFTAAIHNSTADKVENCAAAYSIHRTKPIKWGQMDAFNRRTFSFRRKAGTHVRNQHLGCLGLPCKELLLLGCRCRAMHPTWADVGRRGPTLPVKN